MSGFEALINGRVLVDRYRVEEVIGRGGMGAVYRATDERLGRAVAVKMITAAAPDAAARDRMRARFRHEAASAARLPHHPNVVPVYDYGTDPTLGMDFLVMELLRGEDLAATLGRIGPPPVDVALDILAQAARGVAVGHRGNLIHRDIKPGNIFLVQTDETEPLQVRVLDFGIAKAITAEEDTQGQLTQDGRAPLSPAYASPEQLRGEQRLTPASDVFSLGAVGFQLLTGIKPFSETDRNRMIIGQAVPAPTPRARNPEVPPAVEAILLRCLAHDPQQRFPNASTLADAIDRARRSPHDLSMLPPVGPAADSTQFDDDRTLYAPPPRPGSAPERETGRRRRHEEKRRLNPSLWAIPLLLLGAGGIFALREMSDRPPGQNELLLPPAADTTDTTAAVVVEPQPVDSLGLDDPAGAYVSNRAGLRDLQAGNFQSALEHFRRAHMIVPDNAEYRNNYAIALLNLGQYREAADELEYITTSIDPNRVVAHLDLANARLAAGDTSRALIALDRVRRLPADAAQRAGAEQLIARIQAVRQAPHVPPPPLDTRPSTPVPDTLLGQPRDTTTTDQ